MNADSRVEQIHIVTNWIICEVDLSANVDREKKIIQTYVEHGQLKYLFVRLKQRVGENAVTFQDIKKAKTKFVHPFSSATIFLRVA